MATLWSVENFSRGLHTKPARIEGGEGYAADIENLRVDENGYLRLRDALEDVDSGARQWISSLNNMTFVLGDIAVGLDIEHAPITGVASTVDSLFFLRADGALWFHPLDDLDEGTEITDVANLEGRLSVVNPPGEFVIITSEGDDQGYWIDLRSGDGFGKAHSLGLDSPVSSAYTIGLLPRVGGTGLPDGIYVYALSWLRDAEGEPFHEMESNTTTHRTVTVGGLDPGETGRVTFTSIEFPEDEQVTHLAIYRARHAVPQDEIEDLDTDDFRRIGTAERGSGFEDTTEYPDTAEGDDAWEALSVPPDAFHNRLPPEVKQIHYHASRIFAPAGDRLIYSDFDGLIPRYEVFPPAHNQPRPDSGQVTFCASHRESLLFGSSDGLFRLEGQDQFDFEVDQIGASGPIDGYAWGVFEQTLGFVSDRGFHITDASSVELVSDESLDEFFRGKTLTKGAVGFFTDNTLLFLAQTDDENLLFLFDDKHWVRWSVDSAGQFAASGGQIYIGGETNLRRIVWGADNTDDELAWAYESNLIHGQEAGVSKALKRFTVLRIAAAADVAMTLKTWINDSDRAVEKEFTTRDVSLDREPQVVPIERIGTRLRFRLEGRGPVEIRGLEVDGEV